MSTPAISPPFPQPGATTDVSNELASSFRRDYLGDLYLFDWKQFSWRVPAMCLVAIALCLGIGIAGNHAAAGMIAAGGAMTIGFGAMQSIDGSRFVPMISGSLGMALSTFIGMVAGHENYILVATCALWGFGYGLLTTRAAGVSWVGQQSVVYLLVASAFPATIPQAAERASLVLAGGILQILLTGIQLRVLRRMRWHLYAFLRHSLEEQAAFRVGMAAGFRRVLGERAPPNPVFRFGIRLAVVLGVSSEIYRRLQIPSGYWIPMTAMLVLKPAFNETVKRALARIAGTMAGAVLTTYLVAHWQPTQISLAILVLLFAFLSYSMLSVNYALFTLFLTAYIVFLLALTHLPGNVVAHRRAYCTVVGGVLALAVHLDAIRRWRKKATAPSRAMSPTTA